MTVTADPEIWSSVATVYCFWFAARPLEKLQFEFRSGENHAERCRKGSNVKALVDRGPSAGEHQRREAEYDKCGRRAK